MLQLDAKIYQSLIKWYQRSGSLNITKTKEGADYILAGEIISYNISIDAWILPFLDVYIFTGHVEGESVLKARTDWIDIIPEFEFKMEYSGDSMGYGNYFEIYFLTDLSSVSRIVLHGRKAIGLMAGKVF